MNPPFTGHFRITADTPRGLQPFQPGTGVTATQGKPLPVTEAAATSGPPKPEMNLEIRKNVYDSAGNKVSPSPTNGHPEAPKKQYNCYSCGVDCSRVRYHNAKTKNFELCPNCFLEGRFPSMYASTDFVMMEDVHYSAIDQHSPWTDQETLLLLEGLEMFNDDWNRVADHVGTRTREQCLIRFLQLPIEDQYVEERPEQLGPLQYNRVPFSQADNPVMSVVAFLATMVDPKVAATAAQSSVEEMTKALQEKINIRGKSEEKEKAEEGKETTKSDAMAVDSAPSKDKESGDESSDEQSPISKIASVALGTSAARAHALASHEERDIARLINLAVNATLRKHELKLAHFNELEEIMAAEQRELEKGRQQLFLDRLEFRKYVRETEARLKEMAKKGGYMDSGSIEVQREKLAMGVTESMARPDVLPLSAGDASNFTSMEL